jgi:hypothetical protein
MISTTHRPARRRTTGRASIHLSNHLHEGSTITGSHPLPDSWRRKRWYLISWWICGFDEDDAARRPRSRVRGWIVVGDAVCGWSRYSTDWTRSYSAGLRPNREIRHGFMAGWSPETKSPAPTQDGEINGADPCSSAILRLINTR